MPILAYFFVGIKWVHPQFYVFIKYRGEKMQVFMCGQDVIWQFGVLVILEQKSDQEHFICKSEADAINLYDHLMARLEDQHS